VKENPHLSAEQIEQKFYEYTDGKFGYTFEDLGMGTMEEVLSRIAGICLVSNDVCLTNTICNLSIHLCSMSTGFITYPLWMRTLTGTLMRRILTSICELFLRQSYFISAA